MIYLSIVVLLVLLSIRYDIKGKTLYKDEWYIFVLVVFVLLAGLRWRLCMDTPNYIDDFYDKYPNLQDFSLEDFPIGKDPLYAFINSIVKTLGGRFYIVQLVEAAFVNILVLHYLRRHCQYLFIAILFYALTCYIGFSMEIMRAAMSIALSLYVNDFFLEKKWVKGYLLLLIGCLIHAQTIVLLVLPLFLFLRFNKIGLIIVICAFFIGKILQPLVTEYLILLEGVENISNKAAGYLESDQYGGRGGNLNFMIVHVFPCLIYGMISLLYLKWKKTNLDLMRFEPFIMLGFLFLIIQINLQIAYRYVDYYSIYFVIFLSEAFGSWTLQSDKLTKLLAYVRTFVFFVPFFFLYNYFFVIHLECIYPYSSVIDRTVNDQREAFYNSSDRSKANIDRY